jgi:hypothetical protein
MEIPCAKNIAKQSTAKPGAYCDPGWPRHGLRRGLRPMRLTAALLERGQELDARRVRCLESEFAGCMAA